MSIHNFHESNFICLKIYSLNLCCGWWKWIRFKYFCTCSFLNLGCDWIEECYRIQLFLFNLMSLVYIWNNLVFLFFSNIIYVCIVLHIVLFNVYLILFVNFYFYNFLCCFLCVGFWIVFVIIFIILFCSPKVSIGTIKELEIWR